MDNCLITENLRKIYLEKNADYGNSVHDTFEKYGIVSIIVRLCDKMNRIKTLENKAPLVKNESMKDTILDTINYCILALGEIDYLSSSKDVRDCTLDVFDYFEKHESPWTAYELTVPPEICFSSIESLYLNEPDSNMYNYRLRLENMAKSLLIDYRRTLCQSST